MKNSDQEHLDQCEVVQWFRLQIELKKYPEEFDVFWATPNGGKRDKRTASKIKNEGGRRGVPDLFWAVPNSHFFGLFIEMKTEVGSLSKEQKELIPRLRKNGYCVEICHNPKSAIMVIMKYLAKV